MENQVDPWLLELIVVRGASHHPSERRSLVRDAERGLLARVRAGVYVERVAFESLSARGQHIVRMRALAATASRPPVFSLWSAAVALGLPILGLQHLQMLHTTVQSAGARGRVQVVEHVAPLRRDEVCLVHGLWVTVPARTAVDVARSAPFVDGVVVVDGVLHSGVPRDEVESALDRAGALRGAARAGDVVAFARAESGSALESVSRHTQMRLGVAPLVLQHPVLLRGRRVAIVDFWDPEVQSAGEADGDQKLLDPAMAKQGTARALVQERWREKELLQAVNRVARWGYAAAFSPAELGPILATAWIRPSSPRATLADYCRPFRRSTAPVHLRP